MSYDQNNNFTSFGPIIKSSGNNSEGIGIGNAFAPSLVDHPKSRTRRQDLNNAVENTSSSWPQDSSGNVMQPQWIEIDICVSGTPMKMKVLGTAPYTPV